ncbi:MAG: serine/threonine protein kinase [Micrococcales bacterium]|nr:serine/threonine protein kinase [Micrococcales bacterium]
MAAHDQTERLTSPGPPAAERATAPVQRIGPYRLIEEIGEGGMGVVHLALDPRGRAVAIKVLRAHVAHDDDARARLGREVETLSRIHDRRVASVIDADIMGPRPYIVTRYVPGVALDDLVEQDGPLPPDALLGLARGVAEAIRTIHASGVVHRDIKPGNVLLEDGDPVLIDFGIAHLQDDVRHTVGGLVMGTPGYLSPELVEGAAITDATDWWGWAATITYAASGRPPFGRGRMDAVLSRVRSGAVDLDGVDTRLAPLLRASLSPWPGERPHADDVIHSLEQFAAGHQVTVPSPSGRVWDNPDRHDLPAVTEALDGRSTSILPRQDPPRAYESDGQPGRSRWAPAPGQAHFGASPAAYDDGNAAGSPTRRDADYWDPPKGAAPDEPDDWWADEPHGDLDAGGRDGDPRIGLPLRTGALLSAAACWLGLVAAWPVAALIALVAWSILARTCDRSMTGLVLRRYDRGRRGSDVPLAVLMAPWHVLVGVLATVATLVLPAVVAVAGVFTAALVASAAVGRDVSPGTPITLVGAAVLGLVTAWWGPGGTSLRRGSRSIVRTVLPQGVPGLVVCGLLVGAGVLLLLIALSGGASLGWAPLPGNPFIR